MKKQILYCWRDNGKFRKGEFYDLLLMEKMSPYRYIRPEMTIQPFQKVPKADIDSSFIPIQDNLLHISSRVKRPIVKTAWHKNDIPETLLREDDYYSFPLLTHRLLRKFQATVASQFHYFQQHVISLKVYEELKSLMRDFEIHCKALNSSDEELEAEIDSLSVVVKHIVDEVKSGKYR